MSLKMTFWKKLVSLQVQQEGYAHPVIALVYPKEEEHRYQGSHELHETDRIDDVKVVDGEDNGHHLFESLQDFERAEKKDVPKKGEVVFLQLEFKQVDMLVE